MVHALTEAHRVLKPGGHLIDLRPGAVRRAVGLVRGGRFQLLGQTREKFDDDRAADRAVARVVRAGLFRLERRRQFICPRVMDSLDEFRAWMDEFVRDAELAPHDWLVRRVERALAARPGKAQIAVRGPLVMQALRKLEKPAAAG